MIETNALREKVLDLAIRGKLVPQNPNDEPASVLLERIRAEKEQMVKDGKLKAKDIKNDTIIFKGEDNLHYEKFQDGTVKCIEDEIPFDVPEGWEWSRFSSAFVINPRNNLPDDTEVSFVPMPLIQEGYANNHTTKEKIWSNVKSGFTHFAENDIGVAKITPCFENKKSVVFKNLKNGFGAGTTELHIIRSINDSIYPEYILWNIKTDAFISNGVNAFSGAVGQKRIGKDFIEKSLIPIAPTPEQKRIIERVSTAFKCIDKIDVSKEAFKLDIDVFKRKILDLAIRGKLVPQDPNDEPAAVLLERIRTEKEELIKQGKIKRDKKESFSFKGDDNSYYEIIGENTVCIDDTIPYDLPIGWSWCKLKTLSAPYDNSFVDGPFGSNLKTEHYTENREVRIIQLNNIGEFVWRNNGVKYTTFEHAENLKRCISYPEDIVIAKMMPAGRTIIIPHLDKKYVISSDCVRLRLAKQINNKYVMYMLNSPIINSIISGDVHGIGRSRTSLSKLKEVTIPLPPCNEQERIVTAIETAFAQLDNIINAIS